ncbi:MAG: ATP-binding cassette domain-containing protein, partial [Caldisericia bacterium]|nr:ATP-binding cassette domain-containing protein [Caldisericia bacterium]
MQIEVKNLTHIYDRGMPFEYTALDDVSVTIKSGCITGIIGSTGSGKSTLIQHFNALLLPTKGSVFVDGEDISEKKMDKKRL